jgi:predicted anti-sigma-YlaC factor YlaD
MDCEWTERVSLFIDGESGPDESVKVEKHLNDCPICQAAQGEFLALRKEINGYESRLDPFATSRALTSVLRRKQFSFWRHRIAVPVPALALILVAVFILGALALRSRPTTGGTPITPSIITSNTDLAAYDRGGRATIQVIKRSEAGGGR